MFTPRSQAGLSLIELVMFIVIVGVAVAGVLSVMNVTTQHSADPMIRKQAQAIAESLLEEIELQPFTYCFPTDPLALTASSASGCTGGVAGSEDTLPATARVTSPRNANNVSDYMNFSMSPIVDIAGSPIAGLGAYTASVNISQAGATFSLPAAEVLQIDVRVVSGDTDITLTGYRFRYAPNAVP
ncbi:MAG TPA: prepilin-type N-terminal cleavage/methylation domain-containing protein [Sulfuriferula sp.]|nr:prepilin-type N-terminal cleavage/methylation domain-containing protein [Sulfuriferula sp.]